MNPIFGFQNTKGVWLGDQLQIGQVFGRYENLGASLGLISGQAHIIGVFVVKTAPYSLFLLFLVPRAHKLFNLARTLDLVFKQICGHWERPF